MEFDYAVASDGFDVIFGFAFFVEVAAVDVVYDRDGKQFHLQMPKGSSAKLFIGYHIRLLDAPGNYGAGHHRDNKGN